MDNDFLVLGGMAGSSMDGLDLIVSRFTLESSRWNFFSLKTETIPYPESLFQKLERAPNASEKEKNQIDMEFGKWIGQVSANFISGLPVELAAIHGHTVIHQPTKGISRQLGSGSAIAQHLQIPTITDFRSKDVQMGGQGAPLVPFGDFILFDDFDACLNLGGIANISIRDKRLAWDISPCNQVLNHFAQRLGEIYDAEGALARSGSFDGSFFDSLAANPYYSQLAPKSLPNKFISDQILEMVSPPDGLHTFVHFVSEQIRKDLAPFPEARKLLITGGGARNEYLVDTIKNKLDQIACIVPDGTLIDFKEALVFAFLGLKCYRQEINTLASVTGANEDSCGGVIHLPK